MERQAETQLRTSTLLRRLFKAPNLKGFIEGNAESMEMPPFHDYISGLCQSMGLIPEQVIRQASIERTYGHQLFNGTRNPSRDKVIQLAFGFGLDVEGARALLRAAQKNPLYPRIKRDAVILYCLNHGMGVVDAQSMLHDLGLTLLGGEERHG